VVPHADDHEGRRRNLGDQVSQRAVTLGSEDRLVDDHHRRSDALKQPSQIAEVGHRRQRLDAGLALEQRPQRFADAPVRGREEDRDGVCDGCRLRRHVRTSIAPRRPVFIGERG
jgi:hypothetical protein